MPFTKGQSGNPAGRKPGSQNVSTRLMEMAIAALDKAGGEKYLATQAKKTPAAFLSFIGKLLPRDMHLTHEGGVTLLTFLTALHQAAEKRKAGAE